jgi:putative SOS response-associated peptidase YedK
VLPLARFVEGRAWFAGRGGRPLAVAGLYRLGGLPPGTGGPSGRANPPRRATMLTRPADEAVEPFHDRMPVILPAALIGPWLAGEALALDRLLAGSPPLEVEPITRPGPPPPEQASLL